jgi:hypothetical protein
MDNVFWGFFFGIGFAVVVAIVARLRGSVMRKV